MSETCTLDAPAFVTRSLSALPYAVDELDPGYLMRIARAMDKASSSHDAAAQAAIAEIIVRRRQIVAMRESEEFRRERTESALVAAGLDTTIRTFTRLIAELDHELERYLNEQEQPS